MKKHIFLDIFLCVASIVMAQKIEFKETTYNFGDVPEDGGNVTHVFEFTNTGNAPLVVSNVEPACGCTIPQSWTKEPVAPKATGKIYIAYTPKNRPGAFHKSIKVVSNSIDGAEIIYIEGNVKKAEQPQ